MENTRLYQFKVMTLVVSAVRVPQCGFVVVKDRKHTTTPGTWIVADHHGALTEWTDEEFRKTFEPVDQESEYYWDHACAGVY